MTISAELLGQLLSTGLGGYAGAASSALLDQHSELDVAAGPGAFDLWKLHYEQRLSELAAALSFQKPELFAQGAVWSRAAIEARDGEVEHFSTALSVLEKELVAHLPEGSHSVLAPYFQAAEAALSSATPVESALEHKAALEFLQHTLDGASRKAADLLLDRHRDGESLDRLFETIVIPSQHEIGVMWHRGELNIAEEHLATLTTQKAIAVLAHHVEAAPANGRTVLVSSVIGDTHDLGLRLLSELFAVAGWRSILLGADVPRVDLIQAIDAFEADLLVLSGTLSRHLVAIRSTIEIVRRGSRRPQIKVLVGGRAFSSAAELWREVGADGWSATLSEAVAEGERLLQA